MVNLLFLNYKFIPVNACKQIGMHWELSCLDITEAGFIKYLENS